MVMARSRLKRWMSVGAFSNSSEASCDRGSVLPLSEGTRTCSSAANSACCVIGVRTTIGYCSPGRVLEGPHVTPATARRTARSSSAVCTPNCCALRESMRNLRLVRATLSGFLTSRVPGVAFDQVFDAVAQRLDDVEVVADHADGDGRRDRRAVRRIPSHIYVRPGSAPAVRASACSLRGVSSVSYSCSCTNTSA